MIINGEKQEEFNSTTWGYFVMAGMGCYETKTKPVLVGDNVMEVPMFTESNRNN